VLAAGGQFGVEVVGGAVARGEHPQRLARRQRISDDEAAAVGTGGGIEPLAERDV